MTFGLGTWTEERVSRLKQLWAQGLSCSQIAADLGGTTRNAIIGKVHRLHLAGREPRVNQIKGIPRHRKMKRPVEHKRDQYIEAAEIRVSLPKIPRLKLVEPIPLRLPLFDLTKHTCKYPVTDDLPLEFCGHPSVESGVYCEYHEGVCYNT